MIFRLIVAFLLAAASAHATSGSGDMLTPTDCRQRLDDGWVAIDHSRVAESYALLQPCLAVARQGEPEPWKVEIRIALAVGALGAGDYRRGLELAREAVAQTTRLDDRALRIEALNTEADMHFYLGDLESALATFERAAALHETGDDPVSQAITLKNIGVTENNMGRPERALWSLKRARELAPEDEPAHELWISILGNLGAVYERLGAAELALGAYQEALEHVELRENPEERVDILLRLGRLYLDQGLVTQAVATLEQGQALAAVHSAVPNRAWLASILADAYQLAGRLDEARELMVENVRLRRLAGSPPHMAVDLIDLGSLEQQASPHRAEALFAEALAWVDGRLPQLASWALAKQAELRLAAGETEQAVALAQRAVTTLEGVYSAPEAVAGDLPRHGVYPTALASLLERGSPADYHQAFAYAEQALSKAMLRRLMLERLTVDPLAGETGETLAGEPLDPELERRRRQLEERLQRLQQQLDPSAETAPETLDLLAEARAEHEALIRLIRQRSPHFAALRYPVPLTADQARDLLDERTALVTYVPLLGDELAVFVLDRLTLEVVRLPAKPRELASRIAGYLELLARPEDDGWRAVSRDLHRQLFEPVRSRLSPGVESLILIVDRELAQLPFESLLAPAGGGIGDRGEERFLIEDFAVSYAPSATLLAELDRLADEQRPEELATLLAIGPPAVSPSSSGAPESSRRTWAAYELEGQAVEPLPGAAAEAVSVARYGGDGTVSRIGPAASESWLRQQPLEAFDVLHFATHGLLSPLSSARSALLLTGDAEEDGFLQAREISRLHLAADLVVLSACQTVERETPGGDGMQGIAESFFHAGAASVVGSLWQVTDQSSRRLMESFYRHLADGASKTMALRRAKLDALADAASRHPAHWAAFVLIGEGAGTLPLARPASWPRHLGLGILGLCVLGLTLGYLRR